MLLKQARFQATDGDPRVASWFYDMAYELSGQDEIVAIELANQFKSDGNYSKAEYTLSNAIKDGVRKVFIIDGRVPHALLIECLTDEGAGTMVVEKKNG